MPDPDKIGEKEEWYRHFPDECRKTTVPSCINNRLGFMEFQSVMWYRKDFYAEGGATIKFHAVTELAYYTVKEILKK